MFETLSLVEIVGGLIGFSVLGLGIFWLSQKEGQNETHIHSLGIHKEIQEKNPWWNALSNSRTRFIFQSHSDLNALRESVEEACLASDLGFANTQAALDSLPWKEIMDTDSTQREAKTRRELAKIIEAWIIENQKVNPNQEWPKKMTTSGPTVLWFVGVNGVGKTTSIAKIARELKNKGHSVLLAAGDTFRAAASEQLEQWAKRLDIPCVRGNEGSDSSSLLYDAIESAKAKNIEFVLCDSAGRLHNNKQLMEALLKNQRVMGKALEGAPHETLLVLDANTGQNMIKQAAEFLESVKVTGLILSKLDGSARGGAVVAVSKNTQIPIRRLGLGESAEALSEFDAIKFSRALIGLDEKSVL